jgi:hypothetical protein
MLRQWVVPSQSHVKIHLGLTKIVASKCFINAWQADPLCTRSLGKNVQSFFCLDAHLQLLLGCLGTFKASKTVV